MCEAVKERTAVWRVILKRRKVDAAVRAVPVNDGVRDFPETRHVNSSLVTHHHYTEHKMATKILALVVFKPRSHFHSIKHGNRNIDFLRKKLWYMWILFLFIFIYQQPWLLAKQILVLSNKHAHA